MVKFFLYILVGVLKQSEAVKELSDRTCMKRPYNIIMDTDSLFTATAVVNEIKRP